MKLVKDRKTGEVRLRLVTKAERGEIPNVKAYTSKTCGFVLRDTHNGKYLQAWIISPTTKALLADWWVDTPNEAYKWCRENSLLAAMARIEYGHQRQWYSVEFWDGEHCLPIEYEPGDSIHSGGKKIRRVCVSNSDVAQICLNCPTPLKRCDGVCQYYHAKYKALKEARNEKWKTIKNCLAQNY